MNEYQYLVLKLQEDIEARAQSVAFGNCQSYEEYKHTVGIIRGLAHAVDSIKDREQQVKDSDE